MSNGLGRTIASPWVTRSVTVLTWGSLLITNASSARAQTLECATISKGGGVLADGSIVIVGEPVVGVMANAQYTIELGAHCLFNGGATSVVQPPLRALFPHDRRKNRYISFDPNKTENDGTDVAFRVELSSINMGSCDDATGAQGGNVDFCRIDRGAADCKRCSTSGDSCIAASIDCPPGASCDPTGATCANDLPNAGGSNVGLAWWVGPEQNGVHLLVSQPFRKESTNWANPVHVGDCEIVPEAVYGVRAVDVSGETASDELLIETTLFAPLSASWWGDCVGPLKKFCGGDIRTPECIDDGDCTAPETCDRAWTLPDGSVNFDDINAALALVAPGPTSVAPETTWVDVHGNATGTLGSQNFDPPNFLMNFSDIGQILSGFGGFPYKGYDPADCPDTGTWP